ncbi:MAG: mandelate racemase/muconate lactonizing enzyme family protein [Ectothiorhodospiraceae bacterium]|nr:mandelate racemase/muconate lactonizing enzyme family protein [Ectothiorhodospiraceae bacterium]
MARTASRIDEVRIDAVTVDPTTHWVFLTLIASDGTRGVGEALLGGQEPLLLDALGHAARGLRGKDVSAAAVAPAPLAVEAADGLLEATVRSTVDQALWDLRARAAALPLARMLGPVLRTEIPLYANINRGTRTRSAEAFAARARAARDDGFRGVKLAPFDGVTRRTVHGAEGQARLRAGIERVRAVREAIGPDVMLMVDCHCRLDLPAALQVLDALAPVRLDWMEDVLPYHDLAGWRALRASSRAMLVGGETARGIRDLLPFMVEGLWDVVMPDIRFFGGVTELVALGPLATQYQVALAPHNPRGPIATLASAHAMAGCHAFSMLEYQYGECDWREALVGGAEVIEGGALRLPEGVGIGGELDPAVVAAHPYAPGRGPDARDPSKR